ncbi:MAG: tRNA (N(6)-L-threonylcarbamoyladenosine(37)-C(2))-methylthiotransferase MtaB [Lentisphaeria bacterium]|nr:tRNA (N(6)-L-threonylcarbamoyladenosine(37)-C(2))-methylthiotransferase MtaB [Lentisphaeria bacterium]
MAKKAVILTLGCRLNHADTALLTRRLQRAGFELVPQSFADEPDLVLLNSCAVTAEAVRKSRQMLRQFRKKHPHACIVVSGCAVMHAADELRRDGATIVFGNNGKKQLEEFLENMAAKEDETFYPVFKENATSSFPFRSRAFIKIQEGCNNFCTYCIVPHVRGRERSRSFEEALADCQQAVEQGFPEIILTGVNTCAYSDNGRTLGDLIRKVAEIRGDFRIRLSSTEPDFKNIGLLDVMAETPKVCRFLHISLQHGCNRILRKMNRHYCAEEFAKFTALAREKMPDIHIGTDVIAGFPGETDEDFKECLRFTKQMEFANTHIFTYSRRPGTPAADYPEQVPAKIASERAAELRLAAESSALQFARNMVGKELEVIFEQNRNGRLTGWSDNYLGVTVPAGAFPTGKIVRVTATLDNLALLRGDALETNL